MTLPPPEWLIVVLITLAGLSFGSFVTLVSYRLPRDEPIVAGRSRCPECHTTLGIVALFPLFSWLMQYGKCRYCKTNISARYPLTELVQALLFLMIYVSVGISWEALLLAMLSVALMVMVVVDFEWYIIPDEIQVLCAILALIYHYVSATPPEDVLVGVSVGAILGFGLRYGYSFFRKKVGLGWGDVKFLFVAGLWMAGAMVWAPFLFFAGVFGVATALVWRALGKGERFPFGPALAASLLLMLLTDSGRLFFWTMGRIYE
jgi:prepilin signal peptidase PulO-like enzyme (type II secretory pathway)